MRVNTDILKNLIYGPKGFPSNINRLLEKYHQRLVNSNVPVITVYSWTVAASSNAVSYDALVGFQRTHVVHGAQIQDSLSVAVQANIDKRLLSHFVVSIVEFDTCATGLCEDLVKNVPSDFIKLNVGRVC